MPEAGGRTKHRVAPQRAAFAVAGLLVIAAQATPGAETRFTTVQRDPSTGTLVVEMKARGRPSLWLDGEPLDVPTEPLGGGRHRAVVADTGADARHLALGGRRPTAAIPIGAFRPDEAPFNDRVVYHIMVGYFDNGARGNDKAGMRRWTHHRYAGGDLQGILARADHIGRLGVTDVWLSPVFQSETSHGYDVQNYYRIGDSRAVPGDPEGSLALFRQLVASLRERGVGVILDLPLDYGAGSYDMRAGVPGGKRPRHTRAKQEAEKMWDEWGSDFKYWNFGDDGTRRFLKDVALHWLGEGISGYRMDYVRGVDHEFWAEVYAELKAARPDVFIFGEAWQDAHGAQANMGDIALYYAPVDGIGPQFDSLIEFPMKIVMTDVFARGGDARQLEVWLQATHQAYGGHGFPIYFLDSHDMARFMDEAAERSAERLQAAVTFMATLPGPMILFYGTETALSGGQPKPGFTDSGRLPMPWGALDEAFVDRITEVVAMKRRHPVLQRGARLPLMADATAVVMAREDADHVALVAANTSLAERTMEIGSMMPPGAVFEAVMGSAPETTASDASLRWTLAPMSVSVALRAKD